MPPVKTGKTGTTDVRKWRPEGRRRHPGLIEGYDAPDGVADELLKPDGSLRPVWRPLINHLAALPPEARAWLEELCMANPQGEL